MAKDAQDREDLLRDATGYVQRIEFTIADREEPIFCGFRDCGAFSLYWTQGDVLQFNHAGELRRAFWQDRMLACYKRQLHWLKKSEGRVRLERQLLSETESQEFLALAASWLDHVRAIGGDDCRVIGEFPAGTNITQQVIEWLDQYEGPLSLAIHPGLGKKQSVGKDLTQRRRDAEDQT